MKKIEQIKEELIAFGVKHDDSRSRLNSIKGDNLIELFSNMSEYISWWKMTKEKAKEFNSIFSNQLVIEDGVLLCNCTGLESITIPDSVTSIGEYAFSYCSGITSITLPNSVISIGDYAFSYCRKLKSITIPNSVTSIGGGVFICCTGLTSVIIPNSITSIDRYTFYGCSDNLEIIKK